MNKTLLVCVCFALFFAGAFLIPMAAQAAVGVAPSSLSFGTVTVNTKSAAVTVVVTNENRHSVSINGVSSTLSEFIVTGPALPITLSGHTSASFQVVFKPNAAQSFSGNILVSYIHQNGSTSTDTVAVTGSGKASAPSQTYLLSASSSSLSFGNALVGSTASQALTLTNSGTGSVTISQAAITGTGFSFSGCSGTVTVAAGQTMPLTVNFAPASAGSAAGSLSIVSNATNSPTAISVSGTGIQPQISVSPASASFGSVMVGSSGSLAFAIKNTGTSTLNVTQATLAGSGFTLTGIAVPLSIAPAASSTFTLGFTPASASTFSGSLTLASNAPGSPLVIAIAGTGVAQTLQLSATPASIAFGSVATGTSTTQTVTLKNPGNASVSVSQITESGTGFTATAPTLPLTLAAGASTSFTVTFNPATASSLTGSVTVTSTAANSPATVSLSGTGIQPQIAVVPASVSFSNVTVGVTNTQSVTIRNAGTASLSVTQATLAGTGFSLTGLSVPLSVAAGGSSVFTVGFNPASASSFTGSLTLVSNAPSSPLVVALAGNGVAATLLITPTPSSLSFGSVNTGTSTMQAVTLANTGNASVTISQLAETGAGFTVSGCATPVTLAAGQSTSFNVTFDPATTGSLSGNVTVTSNASNSPQVVSLLGTGTAVTAYSVALSWTASSSSYSGFNVYRGSQSGGPYAKVNTSLVPSASYSDPSVVAGDTYYYVATEVDTTGVESSYSTQVSAVIP
jgi:Abnormal spindle-like microcephaly-assoc'd, ASPM-SPD-2-Hydin